MKRAVIYARYSSDNQQESSIEGQLMECKDYALKNDLEIVNEYIDRAISGTTDERPAFQQMISDAKKNLYDFIIVYKIDRFARSTEIFAIYKAQLRKHNVKILSAKEQIGEGASGRLVEGFYELLAEHYSLNLSQNVKRGIQVQAQKYKFLGGVIPMGYDITKDNDYVINEESSVIKWIFNSYCVGKTLTQIKDELNSKGIKGKKGAKLTYSSLNAILTNEIYAGIYNKAGIYAENVIPAIIDMKTFKTAQEKLQSRKRTTKKKVNEKSNFILTGKLFCGHCKSHMVGDSAKNRWGTYYYYYSCNNVKKKNKEHICNKKRIRKEYIEKILFDAIKNQILNNRDALKEVIDNVYEYYVNTKDSTNETKLLTTTLSQINNSINNIMKAIENGIFTRTTKQRLEELEEQKNSLELQLTKEKLKDPIEEKEYIFFRLSTVEEKDMEIILDMFINSIYLYDDYIDIIVNLSSNSKYRQIRILTAEEEQRFELSQSSPAIITLSELMFAIRVRLNKK